jgi:NADH dehydrogenase
MIPQPQTVLVLGGSGFIGRHVVARLVDLGHRVTVLARRRATARHLILLPTVEVLEGDPYDRGTLMRLAVPANAVINLVGVLNPRDAAAFDRAHVELPRLLCEVCGETGTRRIIHLSANGADAAGGPSRYLRSKGEGEAVVMQSGLDWTILRPSVVFGREDRFTTLFARLARAFPVLPLGAADARFQPVYVRDVAYCVAYALGEDLTIGQRYALCGPTVYTLRDLVRYIGEVSGNPRPVLALGGTSAKLQALLLELAPGRLLTRDNLLSMSRDNVCEAPFPPIFGLTPTALEAVAPTWLAPSAIRSQYESYREQSGR